MLGLMGTLIPMGPALVVAGTMVVVIQMDIQVIIAIIIILIIIRIIIIIGGIMVIPIIIVIRVPMAIIFQVAEGKSVGYKRWATKFNLKEMSKTLLFLQATATRIRSKNESFLAFIFWVRFVYL